MTLHTGRSKALEYYPCRYGTSRVLFRGPRRRIDGDYIAFLGSTETYGRFVENPFPNLLEKRLSMTCVNFGAVNAGVDLYLNDPSILDLASDADVKIVQIMGAHAMSNRYYQVHPRRNDRFLKASERLEALFPEVDFTEFHFVRHMLGRLHDVSPERFSEVISELRAAWIARMKSFLSILRGNVVLLWFDRNAVPSGASATSPNKPPFITRSMIEALRPRVYGVIEVAASVSAIEAGTKGMVFNEFEASAASEVLGPVAHAEAADALEALVHSVLQSQLDND